MTRNGHKPLRELVLLRDEKSLITGVDLYLVDINEDRLNLWESLKNREPDILVNNAGVYEFLGVF